jgi:hypothetical protein
MALLLTGIVALIAIWWGLHSLTLRFIKGKPYVPYGGSIVRLFGFLGAALFFLLWIAIAHFW